MIDFPLWNLNLRKYVKSASISTNYNLLGVINHYGTLESGHYTSYVKHHFENEFYLYDDSRVRLVLDKKEIVTKNAYVLFYERI
jgi:ubiquitin C-terminal hydrolase